MVRKKIKYSTADTYFGLGNDLNSKIKHEEKKITLQQKYVGEYGDCLTFQLPMIEKIGISCNYYLHSTFFKKEMNMIIVQG